MFEWCIRGKPSKFKRSIVIGEIGGRHPGVSVQRLIGLVLVHFGSFLQELSSKKIDSIIYIIRSYGEMNRTYP